MRMDARMPREAKDGGGGDSVLDLIRKSKR